MDGGFSISWPGANVLITLVTASGGIVLSAFWWIYRRLGDMSAATDRLRLDVAQNYVPNATGHHLIERIEQVSRDVSNNRDTINREVAKLADVVEHMPDKETTHRLEIALEGMRGEVRVLSERIKPVSAISERLQEAMLERSTTVVPR